MMQNTNHLQARTPLKNSKPIDYKLRSQLLESVLSSHFLNSSENINPNVQISSTQLVQCLINSLDAKKLVQNVNKLFSN